MFVLRHPEGNHDHEVPPERLASIWNAHRIDRSTLYPRSSYHCEGLVQTGIEKRLYLSRPLFEFEPDEFITPISYLEDMISAAGDPYRHFCRLDDIYSQLVDCIFVADDNVSGFDENLADYATRLLSRLPCRPVELALDPDVSVSQVLDSLSPDYFEIEAVHTSPPLQRNITNCWDNLVVTSKFSANVVRAALTISQDTKKTPSLRNLRRLADTTAELLEETVQLQRLIVDTKRRESCFIVQAFLWSSWQRFAMLFFWQALRSQLESGYDYSANEVIAIQGIPFSMTVYTTHSAKQTPGFSIPQYMCKWAFRLLRSERSSATFDYRQFHSRFNSVFSDRSARCIGDQPCNGTSPENCERFVGSRVEDQSAHDKDCLGLDACQRMCWDEKSYRGVQGTRAVCITSTGCESLKYCKASDKTLAISHVWAHGQGGRPESSLQQGQRGGMNQCLHRRYSDIAKAIGCDSYWMDTPCIPEDEVLRSEAIRGINEVFSHSKITLVCDADLMVLDISSILEAIQTENDTRPSRNAILSSERLLVTIVICDWNVRAWTLLEAMKGRDRIHLLCKDNKIVSLKSVLDLVCYNGAVDIAIQYLTMQHLLPSKPPPDAAGDRNLLKRGLISVEEAASLLSHRHASRDNDDVIIWSLLFNEKVFKTAQELWLADDVPHRYGLNSGFLISSAPRIKGIQGLSWAPSRPAIRLAAEEEAQGQRAHLATASYNTSLCGITTEGLHGGWFIHEFICSEVVAPGQLLQITHSYLGGCHLGALLTPITLNVQGQSVPASFRGDAMGPLFAICGRGDGYLPWVWKGVFEWDESESLPEFHREMLHIA